MSEPEPITPPNAAVPTETDEEDILHALYGPPDAGGVYRGEEVPE